MTDTAVIIPAFGQAELLDRCISAVLAAGSLPQDVVVVDDATPGPQVGAVAARHGVRLVRLGTNGGPAAARNAGVAAAPDAAILFFVDSDVVVAPDALACVHAALADPAIAAVFGCYDDRPAAANLVSQYVNLRHREVHRQFAGQADTFWAGCGAVRRDAFIAVGGFDAARRWNFIEDVELGRRLDRAGYRIRLDPALQGKHLKRWTLRSLARTDALFRARPWLGLMLDETRVMRGLNADAGGRASMVAVALIPPCMMIAPCWPWALLPAALALLSVPLLNRRLFRSFQHLRGPAFAVACVPLHAFHLFCVAIGLALGLLHRFVGPADPIPERLS